MSGRQLFGVDKFRDTGKPLLAVLADPNSIFISGLARFKRRTLYANIVNDRTAVYYTTGLDKTDPYTDLDKVKVNYVKGYEDVILDPINPVSPAPQKDTQPPKPTLRATSTKWFRRVPLILALTVFVPIGIIAFFINSAVQTVRSTKRIKQHERGLAGIDIKNYRVNLWINELREAVEDAYENMNSGQTQEYLRLSDDEGADSDSGREILTLERKQSQLWRPTLALAPYQFAAIQALDKLGFRKYPVWIHKVRHSHAAIVVRSDKESFSEGQVVLNHWVREEFLV